MLSFPSENYRLAQAFGSQNTWFNLGLPGRVGSPAKAAKVRVGCNPQTSRSLGNRDHAWKQHWANISFLINCPGVERNRQEADDKKISHCLAMGLDHPSNTLSAGWVSRSFWLSNSLLHLRVLNIKSLDHFPLRDGAGCFVAGSLQGE